MDYRIFGKPMQFWRAHMPRGMQLKSDGFASSLFDPDARFSLKQFCHAHDIPYADVGIPVDVETFTEYGIAFQKQFAPSVSNDTVTRLDRSPDGFLLQFDSGRSLHARKVVLAVGINYFRYVPDELQCLASPFLSHASEHADLNCFSGRDVTVVGGGSSAIDLATLLHEAGARVRVLCRKPSINFHGKMDLPRPLFERIRRPLSGIGPGWRYVFLADAPLLVHYLPQKTRRAIVERVLGPSSGWFMKDRFSAVHTLVGSRLKSAEVSNNQVVRLKTVGYDGVEKLIETEHVIAATGYKIDLSKLSFLGSELQAQIQSAHGYPVLTSQFESSVPGLYFAGASSALSFGPVMRFAVGAGFTARRLARALN
jgi:thioredoxin reductase